ncbi:MAG: hypothetical protein V5B40_03755 [Candidatus Accumulibacter meliphilus]|uniref:hypothetical protein n=1 Tax=Candidatus Accumulibacter meliphilus TaxID=2211374 RepID=UPI002FC3BECC
MSAFLKSRPGSAAGQTAEKPAHSVAVDSAPAAPQMTLPPETLAEIESSLVKSIGPLAKHLVRKSASHARSVEEFNSELADNIPEGSERFEFLKRIERLEKAPSASIPPVAAKRPRQARPSCRHHSSPDGRVVFDPVTLATAEKRLAQYVGPLAKVLIKRAANDSGDLGELYRKLAEHIDSEPERRDFLKGLG